MLKLLRMIRTSVVSKAATQEPLAVLNTLAKQRGTNDVDAEAQLTRRSSLFRTRSAATPAAEATHRSC